MEASATDGIDEVGLGVRVRETVWLLSRRFRSERPEGALGDAALEVLMYLHKRGPHTLKQLSDHAGIAPASMSRSVNRLTSSGYAVRSPDGNDRRKVLFSTTPEGAELACTAREQRNAWLQSQLAALSAADQQVIRRACVLLDEVAASARAVSGADARADS